MLRGVVRGLLEIAAYLRVAGVGWRRVVGDDVVYWSGCVGWGCMWMGLCDVGCGKSGIRVHLRFAGAGVMRAVGDGAVCAGSCARWGWGWWFLYGVARGVSEMAVHLRVAGAGRVQAARDGVITADSCPSWRRSRPLLHGIGHRKPEMRAYRGAAVAVRGRCVNRAKSWGAPRLNNRHGGLAERQAEMGVSSDRMNVNRAMPAHGRRSSRA
ncbi:hypothetical protein BPORC_1718 [Bifidobacterium porcinum]|nr:hypothetical protein BPORC_1718 [Bifidobacterium porcinum]